MTTLTTEEKFEKAYAAGEISDEKYEEIEDTHLITEREKAMKKALK